MFFPRVSQGIIIDGIAAVVDGEVITISEVREVMKERGFLKDPSIESEAGALEYLIEKRLMEKAAKLTGNEVLDTEVDLVIKDVLKRNRITEDELKRELEEEGLSYKAYRDAIRTQILKTKIIGREIRGQVVATEEDLRKFYQENLHNFRDEDEYRIQQIVIRGPGGSGDRKYYDHALRLRERLLKGEKFEEIAAIYSSDPSSRYGGDIGFIKYSELNPKIAEAIAGMREGEISDVIAIRDAYYIIRLLEKRKGRVLDFEEVKKRVEELYIERETEKRFRQWIKDLREKATVLIKM
uniref:Peptidyl-prolyl cis-trans isomerase SurA n=1 Tax=uncultured prokaryote TaxID=198431 RepID=H5SPA9_9ZZZZ|nr:peptidyl-prolyl cis-trans isomerase SurA [uncultured prokaryote]